jgi:hypothetical protein
MMAVLLSVSMLACVLMAQQTTSLIIHGQQGDAKVVQVQGHNYVDIEGLARLTNGTISFKGSQIVLTLPVIAASTPVVPGSAPPSTGVSKDFRTAGVEVLARLREWHAALRIGVEKGVPLATGWLDNYQAAAQDALRMASAVISTDGDKNAYPILISEYNNMKSLNDKFVGMTKSMDYIDPSSFQSDPLNQKVLTCSHFLSSIASTQAFIDDGSCR